MRISPLVLLLSFILVLVSAGPGIPYSKLEEELALGTRLVPIHQQGFGSGFHSFLLKIRARLLRIRTSERWLKSIASETPSSSTQSRSGRDGTFIPNEDFTPPAETSAGVEGEERRKQLGIWGKARRTREAIREMNRIGRGSPPSRLGRLRVDGREPGSPRIEIGRETELTTAGRPTSASPKLLRPTGRVTSKTQRGKELENMPGEADTAERRRKIGKLDRQDMRELVFGDKEFKYAGHRTDNRLLLDKEAETSEIEMHKRYPASWKPPPDSR